MAQIIVLVFIGYAAAGLVFGLWFVSLGVSRLDPAARGSPAVFRLLILPGSAALWPVLLVKLMRSRPVGADHEA
jgi:hypothetical protein